jgi:hypothetical protein
MVNDFDPKIIRKQLDAMRRKHSADSPIGSRCSNLIEQLGAVPTYVRPTWATHECQTLPGLMKRQLAKLTAA